MLNLISRVITSERTHRTLLSTPLYCCGTSPHMCLPSRPIAAAVPASTVLALSKCTTVFYCFTDWSGNLLLLFASTVILAFGPGKLLLAFVRTVILGSEPRGTHVHVFLSQLWPNHETLANYWTEQPHTNIPNRYISQGFKSGDLEGHDLRLFTLYLNTFKIWIE
jgi:hypothetical protein